MSHNPIITVCVTSYNHKRFIRTCIDSLLSQTYPHLDIRVIDDASTDGSVDILKSYGDAIDLTVREVNGGVAGYCPTVNEVMRTARGEFYYRLDSDDSVEPTYFEQMIAAWRRRPELDWICGGLNVLDAEGNVTDRWEYTNWPTDPGQALARGWQTCSVVLPHNGLFKTAFLQKNELYWRHFPYGWGGDVLFTIRAIQCQPHVELLPGTGFNWRTHGGNNSVSVERRVRLVMAVKEYYIDNIPVARYLKHPLLDRHTPGSPEYNATRDFLFAVDIYKAKVSFRVPAMFAIPETKTGLEQYLPLFDPMIRKYAERSLSHGETCRDDVTALIDRLESDKTVREGRRSLALGDFNGATGQFNDALRSNPISASALSGLAEISFGQGDDKRAEQLMVKALQLAPEDPEVLNNAGVILHLRGEYAKAEQAFLKSLAIDSANESTHANLLALEGQWSLKAAPDPARTAAVVRSMRWLSDLAPDRSRDDLMRENHALRDALLTAFSGRYSGMEHRILLHCPDNGALKYLMDSWAEVLNAMGLSTRLLNWGENTASTLQAFRPTCFITVADPAFIEQIDTAALTKHRREYGLQIGHISTLQHRYEPCDFLITFHLDPSRDEGLSAVNLPLLSLPFGINPMQHYMRPGRELWDFFFVGTNSPLKVRQTHDYLMPLLNTYSGILAGIGWRNGLGELPVNQATHFYNFAAIYPNFHLENNFRAYNEITERSYIIPACGGFELSDSPVAMKELFGPDEIAQASSPAEYRDMFRYYLDRPDERLSFVRKAMFKVYERFTLFHRLEKLALYLGESAGSERSTAHDGRASQLV